VNYIIFHEYDEFIIERPQKFGGNIAYCSFEELKSAFEQGSIHPMDLKLATSVYLNKIISPIRNYLGQDEHEIF
jgi:tyrosyl-tRNA synthetase